MEKYLPSESQASFNYQIRKANNAFDTGKDKHAERCATYTDFFFLDELEYDAAMFTDKKMTAEMR